MPQCHLIHSPTFVCLLCDSSQLTFLQPWQLPKLQTHKFSCLHFSVFLTRGLLTNLAPLRYTRNMPFLFSIFIASHLVWTIIISCLNYCNTLLNSIWIVKAWHWDTFNWIFYKHIRFKISGTNSSSLFTLKFSLILLTSVGSIDMYPVFQTINWSSFLLFSSLMTKSFSF